MLTLLALTACGGGSNGTDGGAAASATAGAAQDTSQTRESPGGTATGGGSGQAASSQKPQVSVPDEPPPTELTSEDLVVGDGPQAPQNATVTVHYVGVLWSNGEQFDSSWDRGQPAQFPLNGVVPGFRIGIAGNGDDVPSMRVGGRRRVVIPPDLGYGSQAQGPIPADSTLVFVIDLLEVSEGSGQPSG